MYIMAHRGASGFAPENTMAAFKIALKKQVDCIELDVRLTKDEVPVVIHDAHIYRTSNGGKQYIHELTLEELKKYDFGSWYGKGEFSNERIPLLEEVLELVEDENVDLNIEIKNGPIIPDNLEEKVLNLVNKYNLQDRSMYSSFDHKSLKKIYEMDNNNKVGLIFHMNLINLFEYIENTGIDAFSIHPNFFYVTKDMIKEAHKRNIKLNIYTLDDMELVEKYTEMGVDGLITNKLLTYPNP